MHLACYLKRLVSTWIYIYTYIIYMCVRGGGSMNLSIHTKHARKRMQFTGAPPSRGDGAWGRVRREQCGPFPVAGGRGGGMTECVWLWGYGDGGAREGEAQGRKRPKAKEKPQKKQHTLQFLFFHQTISFISLSPHTIPLFNTPSARTPYSPTPPATFPHAPPPRLRHAPTPAFAASRSRPPRRRRPGGGS